MGMDIAEQIAQLANKLESTTRSQTIAEMIAELSHFAEKNNELEAGWAAAIEFLKENFS